jgi:putative protein-disulfide isomerase
MVGAIQGPVLYYIHDPMCSWCWGFRPVWEQIQAQLPPEVSIVRVLGGLAPDTQQPMPEDMRLKLQGTWRRIEAQLGARFNFDFWNKTTPRRSTYPACRAVIAAARQDRELDMIAAIQEAYYLRALNPALQDILVQLAAEMSLDTERFAQDLADPATHRELLRQIRFSQQLGASGFPSLILEYHGHRDTLHHDYRDPDITLSQIGLLLKPAGSKRSSS